MTTSLTLGSLPALAVGPFTAVLAYVVAVLYVADDGLGRATSVDRCGAEAATTSLVDAPAGRPTGATVSGAAQLTVIGVGELLQGHGDGAQLLQQGQLPAQQPRLHGQPPPGGRLASSACRSSVVSSATDGDQPGQLRGSSAARSSTAASALSPAAATSSGSPLAPGSRASATSAT